MLPLSVVQTYADDIIDALCAAATVYVAAPGVTNGSVVTTIVADLQACKTAINSAVTETSAQGVAVEIVGFAQQLLPIVEPFMGPAAPFAPMALAVIQAFITMLPNTPTTPPAELHQLAMTFRAP